MMTHLRMLVTFMMAISASAQSSQQLVPPPDNQYPLHVHVIGSLTQVGGRELVVIIDGQPMMIQSTIRTWPLALGDYQAQARKGEGHNGDVQRQYTLQLTNGKQEDFRVVGLCERGATVCFGFSVPPSQ